MTQSEEQLMDLVSPLIYDDYGGKDVADREQVKGAVFCVVATCRERKCTDELISYIKETPKVTAKEIDEWLFGDPDPVAEEDG